MTETAGILDLNIARLDHKLKVIEQQLAMSGCYPDHREKLRLARSQVKAQLDKIIEQRNLSNPPPPPKTDKTSTACLVKASFDVPDFHASSCQ